MYNVFTFVRLPYSILIFFYYEINIFMETLTYLKYQIKNAYFS